MDYVKKLLEYLKILNTRGFWAGFVAGSFYFSYVFWWIWQLYPLDWLPVESNALIFFGLSLVFIICVAITALWWGISGFLIARFWKDQRSLIYFPIICAAVFTMAEYLRSIFFSIVWFGSGGAVGPHWPLGNIANWLIDLHPIAITASFWGIYGITFFVSLIIFSLAALSRGSYKKAYLIQMSASFIFIGILNIPYLYQSKTENESPIPVAVIQTDLPSRGSSSIDEMLEDFQAKANLIKEASGEIKKGLIILPEGSSLLKNLSHFLKSGGIEKYFNGLSDEELLIVDNSRIQDLESKSRSILISSKAGAVGFYDKEILIPIGEYMPYIFKLPLSVFAPTFMKNFKLSRESSAGSESNVISYNGSDIKLLTCSDVISPHKAIKGNSDFVIITGSYSIWNRGSSFISGQVLPSARFRAIENGKYAVLSSNSGRSFIINPSGKIESSTESEGYKLLTGSIIPSKGRTWYNYIGDWPILLLSLLVLFSVLKSPNNDIKS